MLLSWPVAFEKVLFLHLKYKKKKKKEDIPKASEVTCVAMLTEREG